jgi:hypothetical protein
MRAGRAAFSRIPEKVTIFGYVGPGVAQPIGGVVSVAVGGVAEDDGSSGFVAR